MEDLPSLELFIYIPFLFKNLYPIGGMVRKVHTKLSLATVWRIPALWVSVGLCSGLAAFDSTIPVLHLPDFYQEETRGDFLKGIEQAAAEVGFFGLTGTGV